MFTDLVFVVAFNRLSCSIGQASGLPHAWIFVSQWDLFSSKMFKSQGSRIWLFIFLKHLFNNLTSWTWIEAQRDFSLSTSHHQSGKWIQAYVWKQQLARACRAAEWEQWKEIGSRETHKHPISSWVQVGLLNILHKSCTSDPQFESLRLDTGH